MELLCLLFLTVIGHLHGSPLDMQFASPSYNKITELRVKDCQTDLIGLISQALAGDSF
jgi:hypothetical protein